MGPVLYPEEIYVTSDFSMSFYITFKKETLACGSQEGHMWVTSGLLVDLWVNKCNPLSTLINSAVYKTKSLVM